MAFELHRGAPIVHLQLVFDGSGYVVLWTEGGANGYDLRFMRLGPEGEDSEPARGPRTSSGCGCRVAGGHERASFAGSLALSLALLRRRRRRAAGGRAAARP